MDFDAIGRWLESGDVDFAVMSLSNAPPEVRARALYTERFVCIARRGHPRIGESIDLDTFCSLDHVMVSGRGGMFSGATDEALATLGRKRRVKLSVPHYLLLPEMVQRSQMIAIVPERLARHYTDRLRIIEPPLAIRGLKIALVWHERTHRDPAQVWVRSVVAAAATALLADPIRTSRRTVADRARTSRRFAPARAVAGRPPRSPRA